MLLETASLCLGPLAAQSHSVSRLPRTSKTVAVIIVAAASTVCDTLRCPNSGRHVRTERIRAVPTPGFVLARSPWAPRTPHSLILMNGLGSECLLSTSRCASPKSRAAAVNIAAPAADKSRSVPAPLTCMTHDKYHVSALHTMPTRKL